MASDTDDLPPLDAGSGEPIEPESAMLEHMPELPVRVSGDPRPTVQQVPRQYKTRVHEFSCYTDFVDSTQNITLSLPRDLLKKIKRLAVDRDTSASALMTEALARLAEEDRRYEAARKRALAAMRAAPSMGTNGRRTWTRDELHGR